jgi:hypothetical protein
MSTRQRAIRAFCRGGLIAVTIFGPAVAVAQNLPADVIDFNKRHAPCLKASGATLKEMLASIEALQKTAPCVALEKEHAELLKRYQGNKLATMALQYKIGIVGVYRYP